MRSIIEIDIADEISPMFADLASKTDIRRASKSLGWFMQREIKQGIRSGSPGGEAFEDRTAYRVRKAVGGGHAPTSWYGKLKNAIGYEYDKGTVKVGWTSRTAAYYGRVQEDGTDREVTSAMRKRFAEAGYPISSNKTEISVPDRPVFKPMARELRSKIAPYVEKKLTEYQLKHIEFGKKNKRKYKVY